MSDGDDFSTGMGALLGRSIGELNGLQRRVDLLEKQVMKLQERQHAQASRRELRVQAGLLFFQTLLVAGLVIGLTSWPMIRSAL